MRRRPDTRIAFIIKVAALATVSAGALTASHALAQEVPQADSQAASETSEASQDRAADVVVVGIRGSIDTANAKKRNAKQIVDSVVSEDVGKLPDNNVPEALSRVTGVQIDRARGQGQGVTIRGMSEIQTTINGNQTNLGDGRALDLADIPAELLKSVDVYKTRSADQVEGGIAGTVNVELRRPLDLKKGLTVAGSVRGSYDDVAEKISPYASLLVGERFDTGIGEIGFLLNGSWTKTFYRETYIESESPDIVCCPGDPNSPNAGLPAQYKDIVLPYRAQYGQEFGHVTRPSLNAVLQWRPSDRLDFVFEGGYIGSREKRSVNKLYALNREWNSTYSNIQLMPDGQTVKSITVSNPNGVPAGIDSLYNSFHSDLYTSNFEVHWHGDGVQINSTAQYNKSNSGNYFVEQIIRPVGLTSMTVDFDSDRYSGGVPSITFNGVDMSNVNNYGVERFQDNRGGADNEEFAAQTDITVDLTREGLLRTFQFGARYNQRITNRWYGYRDGFPRVNGTFAPLTQFPGGSQAALSGVTLGGDTTEWYSIPGPVVLDNIDAIRAYIQATDPGNATRFASQYPPSDRGQTFGSHEYSFAAYGQFNYGFDIGFPVDGLFGVRYVNTWGDSSSFSYRLVNGAEVVEQSNGRGNYVDLLPTATAILHFTPKAQLRLSYSSNVQRPSFYDMRPFYWVDPNAANPVVYAGNPNLKAQREHAFDASAEYYFGRGGAVTLAGYYKKASNYFYYDRQDVPIGGLTEYGVDPAKSGFIEQLRNAGGGTFVGIEGSAQTFFDFLPGMWKNFGVSLNASHIFKARVEWPYPEDFPGAFDALNASKWTVNAALFYDTPQFSARVAYNYRSPYRLFIWTARPEYSFYNDETQRLDAAINFTPFKFVTLSLEGTNLLGNNTYRYFGQDNLLPLGVRLQARTIQASARFRF
ncbi:TonB-dependent receptor [Sphingomonas naasensis]|uniref:TonB-dependent receptor n=1 Tax=Sphingomonas naasensis TaxID=1344951 RepID=A0A4S1WQW8_9SPHN|nr:TonB-dependent receptor [Sphingomonas naasensis]